MTTAMRVISPVLDSTSPTPLYKTVSARTAQQRISIGSLTLVAPRLTKTEVQKNAGRSTEALSLALVRLTRSSIRHHPKRSILLFQADENKHDILIRNLDG